MTSSSLLATRITGRVRRRARSATAPSRRRGEASGFDDEEHHVDVGERRQHGAVQVPVQRRAVAGLESRRVDEDELASPTVRMPVMRWRVVCACRGDADLLPDQGVEQRRLADVGRPTIATQAAAAGRRRRFGGRQVRTPIDSLRSGLVRAVAGLSRSIMRRAASCSAWRRNGPRPSAPDRAWRPRTRPRRSGRGLTHAGRDDAVRQHRKAARLQPPWSCNGLGVLVQARRRAGGDHVAEQPQHQRRAPASRRRGRRRRSRASSASARIDSRRPPPRAVPRLHRSTGGSPSDAATRSGVPLAHQVRDAVRSPRRSRQALEQQARNGQAQHRVAEKLQPLVVVGAEAAVRDGAGESNSRPAQR